VQGKAFFLEHCTIKKASRPDSPFSNDQIS
jgi:hypothetical protein